MSRQKLQDPSSDLGAFALTPIDLVVRFPDPRNEMSREWKSVPKAVVRFGAMAELAFQIGGRA